VTPRAITGLGIVSALGIGRDAFFAAMRAPVLVADLPRHAPSTFDASKYPDAQLAEVNDFDPAKYLGDKGLRSLDRLTKLLVVAARLSMHDGGFKKDNVYVQSGPQQIGVCISNAYGSLEAITELDRVAMLEDARYINPSKFPNTVANSASGYVSIWEDLRALNVSVSDGNCGALDTIACGDIYLETGRADALLVGGAEAMSEALYLAFHRLGALDTGNAPSDSVSPIRGTRLGEGAVLMVMEPLELAEARGAHVFAEVTGYGTSFVAPESEASLIHPSSQAVENAMRAALADAGISPREIDVVASSVSGLRMFDCAELSAIERVFGPDVCVAAPKAVLGETLGAGGAMAMAATMAWFDDAPPCAIVRGPAGAPGSRGVRSVLVSAMGFYGNASAVVMRRPGPAEAR
jgi:3-oxoacyl-[acyl-carrier-protein] synthase II